MVAVTDKAGSSAEDTTLRMKMDPGTNTRRSGSFLRLNQEKEVAFLALK